MVAFQKKKYIMVALTFPVFFFFFLIIQNHHPLTMSDLDAVVYKYLLKNGNTEAAEALKKQNPSVRILWLFDTTSVFF